MYSARYQISGCSVISERVLVLGKEVMKGETVVVGMATVVVFVK